MSNTKGHVAALTDGQWHPRDRKYFMTASLDGSVRIWDVDSKPVGVDS
jgi:WD40 repeat protein